jgi:hypothetical protein
LGFAGPAIWSSSMTVIVRSSIHQTIGPRPDTTTAEVRADL